MSGDVFAALAVAVWGAATVASARCLGRWFAPDGDSLDRAVAGQGGTVRQVERLPDSVCDSSPGEIGTIVAPILASRVGGDAPPGDVILAQHGSVGRPLSGRHNPPTGNPGVNVLRPVYDPPAH